MTSRLGTRFGPYELRSLIGAGATGEVYRAHDTVRDRTVAVKLLPAEMAAEPGFQQRFRRECGIASRLQEPHVIPVHDFGSINGVSYVDMHLVEGGSLKDLLRERGPLEPPRAASIVAQVARALDAAHAAGLVHLGVRPEHVLLTPDHFASLVDLGIGHADGSRVYMAPERFTTGQVGPQTDVYSLACLLYECLTGHPPFEATDPAELKSAHMLSPAPRPSIMRRGIGRAFDDVVARGMAKQPAARFASAGELARAASEAVNAAYEPVAAGVGAGPLGTRPFEAVYPNPDDTGYSPYPVDEAPSPSRPDGWRPVGGRGAFVVTAAAVVLVIAGLVVALASALTRGGSPPTRTAQAPSPAPSSPPPPKTPTLSAPVRGADGLGFVGETARCDPGNPPAAVVRTAKSLAVVCQNLSGSYYYRGERIRDGAHIELSNAERVGDGFDVTNPVDGVRYEVRPNRLRIVSGSHVDSSEPVLQYATAS
ncbi:serine/threonine-protein kinase [Mycobacterium sp. 852014-50255_SCH5639931]|uniref:serine/threonine-protein kinase n=1 Tax=Mycobacterium sp. 852014-50255_SCH5639931 TaxID=1834112 RepID=UPI000800AD8F|nr:serine/threonine-protein kinase [Mycobacterium sp. 852014-50255_SCH5639931]OBB66296.1 protein kinase [Mycobacterium sp. 852014-50255_SCH5639931]